MATRRSWRFAAALAGGVIAVACGSPASDSQSSEAAQTECANGDPICGGAAACTASGQPCTGDSDCCSGSCNAGGLCSAEAGASDSGAAAYCSPAGAACAGASECCSGICDGTCASGSASDSGADGGLTPPPTPTPVPVPACTGSGDDCKNDSDCCSKQCWFSTCILG